MSFRVFFLISLFIFITISVVFLNPYQSEAANITVSGTVYTDEGTTVMTTQRTIRARVNGAGTYSTTAASDGTYSIGSVAITSAGDVVTVYIDNATENANTITITNDNSSNIVNFDLYQNRIIVRHENSGPIDWADVDAYCSASCTGTDTDMMFQKFGANFIAAAGSEFFVPSGETYDIGTGTHQFRDLDVNGTFLDSGAQLQSGAATVTWDWTGGIVTLTGDIRIWGSDMTLTSYGNAINNIKIGHTSSDGYLNNSDDLTINGNVTFETATSPLIIWNTNGYDITTHGNVNLTGYYVGFNCSGSTIIIDGTTSFTSNGEIIGCNLQIGTDSTGANLTLADSLTINGNITVDNNGATTFNISSRTVTSGGDTDLTNLDTFTTTSSTWAIDGTSIITTGSGAGQTFNNLTIGTDSTGATLTTAGDMTLSGTLSVGSSGTTALDISNDTLTLNGSSAKNFTNLDTFTTTNSTVKITGTGSPTFTPVASLPFNNFTVDKSSGTVTLGDNLDVNGNLTITSGTLDANTNKQITLAGNFYIDSNGAFTKGTESVASTTFNGTGTQLLTDASTGGQNLGDIVVNGTSNTLQLGSNATTTSMMVYSGDTLNLTSNGYTLNLLNTATSTPLNVAGTFTPGTSTVFYKAAATPTTVASTTYSTLSFDSGGNANTFTIPGSTATNITFIEGNVITTGVLNLANIFTNTGGYLSQTTGYMATSSTLTFDASSYANGGTITMTLLDANRNISATSTDNITTTLTIGTDTETITLTETGITTGIFTGTITGSDTTSITAENGTLEASANGTITASYQDTVDSGDTSQDTATMTATAQADAAAAAAAASSNSGGGGGVILLPELFGQIKETIKDIFTSEPDITPDDSDEAIPSDTVTDFLSDLWPFFDGQEDIILTDELIDESPIFDNVWSLIDAGALSKFTIAPLPNTILTLANKFPKFRNTLEELNINRLEDFEGLQGYSFTLSGLEDLDDIPIEVVFSRYGNTLLDFVIGLRITDDGDVEQTIRTASGHPVEFVVRPEHEAKSITGYLTLKEVGNVGLEVPLNLQLASVLFSGEDAPNINTVPKVIEEEFLLQEFEYTRADDGTYVAKINAPLVSGSYDIITIIDYKDERHGGKEIRFTLLVDPEGYIYEKVGNKEVRIPNATASIFWKNKDTNTFELWPADKFNQKNPQITNATGEYSFLVPPGEYYIAISAPGYKDFETEKFTVTEGRGVHTNIELQPSGFSYTPQTTIVLLLIMIIILMLYILYTIFHFQKMKRLK